MINFYVTNFINFSPSEEAFTLMIACSLWWLYLSIATEWITSSLGMLQRTSSRRINADLTKVLTKQSIDLHHIQLFAKDIKMILLNSSYHNELFDIDTKTFTAAIRSCNCMLTFI